MPSLFQRNSTIPTPLRVVFLGDSVTDNGTFIAFMDAYFMRFLPEVRPTFINLGVNSETAAGTSEPSHPFPRPCLHDRLDKALQLSQPDWVVLGYGMNDGIYYPFADERFEAYRTGMLKAIAKIREAGCKAIVMTPPPFDAASIGHGRLQTEGQAAYAFNSPYEDYDLVLQTYAKWIVSLGDDGQADAAIDIHTPLAHSVKVRRNSDPSYISGDGIHPNAYGHWVMAKTLLSRLFNITLERMPPEVEDEPSSQAALWIKERHKLLSSSWKEHVGHTNPNKIEALPLAEALERAAAIEGKLKELYSLQGNRLEISRDWNGHVKTEFYLEGREGHLVRPTHPAVGCPWVWRAEFPNDFNQADLQLLREGWHIAYYRLSHMYGCPGAVDQMHHFSQHLIERYGLSPRPSLFGFSRGGLYAANYAAAYPSNVCSLYLDAPVLDIRSWPAGYGDGSGSSKANWADCMAVYGLTEQSARSFAGNPLDAAETLIEARIPVILVAGDSDKVVPYHENGERLSLFYMERQGEIEAYVKPGIGHHPHSLEDPAPIVEFVKRHFTP